jgi:anti-anti-sigma factor
MDFKARTATLEGFDGLLVSVEGGLGIATARTLAEPAELALGASCPLVLDLSKCSFIDWMGLPFVLRAHEALAEVGEAMALVTDHALIRKMLFLTGIDRSVRIFRTRDTAIAWAGSQKAKVPGGEAPSLSAVANGDR